MLEARFLTDTLLEVKESLMGFNRTKVTFWYYDLVRNLVSSTGKEGSSPDRMMSPQQRDWLTRHTIPLAHRQALAAQEWAAKQPERDAELARRADYRARLTELNARRVRWNRENPVDGLTEEEQDAIDDEFDALWDQWKRELRVYNYYEGLRKAA